jgi:RNA methyltransferase, TrmH family
LASAEEGRPHPAASPIGRRNPRLQRLRRLSREGKERAAQRRYVIEGPTLVADAIAAGVELLEVYAEPDAAIPDGVDAIAVETGVLSSIVDAVTSQGIAALARIPAATLADVPTTASVLVAVAVADPGNAGTLLRSAEAAGFGAVLFTSGSADPFAPKCVRASAGSVFRVPVLKGGEAATVLDEVGGTGRRRIATRAHDAVALDEADLSGPVAVVVGNEAHGLPAVLDGHVDTWVSIPMAGRVESLNVAMAGTLLCYEVFRRG